jgi:predicted nuclease of restriction endonuclease-like (RecB) superfamily
MTRMADSIKPKHSKSAKPARRSSYPTLLRAVVSLLGEARHASARTVNVIMTATYWQVGRHIVEFEQAGERRAGYGQQLLTKLSTDLTKRLGRGFSVDHLELMRLFYNTYSPAHISETVSRKLLPTMSTGISDSPIRKSSAALVLANSESVIRKFTVLEWAHAFPLSWTHYVHLLRRSRSPEARAFYETESLRGGWSVRQLDRQMSTLFYERTALSRNKAAMLRKGARPRPSDHTTPEEEIKNPLVLEFLGLNDEYSETELEDALIRHLEAFLLELGGDLAFIGRQRRLRIGGQWYRVDLLFFHRSLRCLLVIDLKTEPLTHADAGQMHLYLNYAREHWTLPGENPPVGLILCSEKDHAVARYALAGLDNKILSAEYRLALPSEIALAAELEKTRRALEARLSTQRNQRRANRPQR